MIDWSQRLPQVVDGRHELSRLSRKLMFRLRRDLFERLPFEDDDSFLEPTYFPAFASPSPAALGSLAVGHFRPGHAPFEFSARSNADGLIVIPNIGSFRSEQTELELVIETEEQTRRLFRRGHGAFVKPSRDFKTPIGQFIVYDHVHHLICDLIRYPDGGRAEIRESDVVGSGCADVLNVSLRRLSVGFPQYFQAIKAVTRGFLPFRMLGVNSFASDSVPGIAFLSLPEHASVPYFLDDVAHQCGHLVFSAMFFDRQRLFDIDTDEPIARYTKNMQDGKASTYCSMACLPSTSLLVV